MAKVLVSGYYGFDNAGDEAILGGILTALRAVDPAVEVSVLTHNQAATARLHGAAGVDRNSPAAVWQALGAADLVLSGGGSLLQDVTSRLTIPYYLGVTSMAKLRGKPVAMYAQGIGPIQTFLGRQVTRLLANRVDLITLRDHESAALLRQLGVHRPRVEVVADAAIALGPGDPERGRALLAQAGVTGSATPLIGVSVRPWKQAGFVEGLAAALDALVQETGGQVLFLPMQVPHDLAAAEAVRQRMKQESFALNPGWDYRQLLDAVAALDLLIGLRYHALVFAAMSAVPLVGLSYDPKNDSFLKLLGRRPAGTADQLSPVELLEAARAELAAGPAGREQLQHALALLAERSRATARLALGLLDGGAR